MKQLEKIFAGTTFFTHGGQLDVTSTEPLTVAFIGGSLTEGEVDYEGTSLGNENLKWANVVIRFLSGLFPLRPIKAVNVGLGGTGSQYGAIRFARDVLSHSPDLIFIEFSCNDCPPSDAACEGQGKKERQIYLESMIRQCMEMDKVPAVIYMHVPVPSAPEQMRLYRKGCALKQEVLDHYGIGTVDAMADVLREFEAEQAKDCSLTWEGFLRRYYEQYESGAFNVHPYAAGYLLFATSVINALMRSPEIYLRPFQMKDALYCKDFQSEVNERYHYLPAASERFSYEGDWTLYTAEHPYESDDPTLRIRPNRLTRAHQFPDGVMQTYEPHGASFSFDTEADRICMPHVSAKAGLGATVYADGIQVGQTTCRSPWHGMNYTGPWIPLPKGKKRIQFVVDDAHEDASVFRFGYVIEAFEA